MSNTATSATTTTSTKKAVKAKAKVTKLNPELAPSSAINAFLGHMGVQETSGVKAINKRHRVNTTMGSLDGVWAHIAPARKGKCKFLFSLCPVVQGNKLTDLVQAVQKAAPKVTWKVCKAGTVQATLFLDASNASGISELSLDAVAKAVQSVK